VGREAVLTQSDLIFNQELAAWVQAVGSVIAIFVAIGIPLYLKYLEKKNTNKLLETQKEKYFVILFPSLYRIRRYSSDFIQQIAKHENNAENIMHTLDSLYLNLIPVFSNELHIFVHSQIYDEDLNQLAFEFFYCEEILQQHLNQPIDQKKKQHQDQIVLHTQKAYELCEKIIKKNEKKYIDLAQDDDV
jgi:type II secretory pathway component PulL